MSIIDCFILIRQLHLNRTAHPHNPRILSVYGSRHTAPFARSSRRNARNALPSGSPCPPILYPPHTGWAAATCRPCDRAR